MEEAIFLHNQFPGWRLPGRGVVESIEQSGQPSCHLQFARGDFVCLQYFVRRQWGIVYAKFISFEAHLGARQKLERFELDFSGMIFG